ncbi:hypothetical protein U1Q18_046233 [Sarracenia purpurea var. burkii]
MQMCELHKLILEMRTTLYGDDRSEPITETCAQLTLEFFKADMLRLLINCLPKLDLGALELVLSFVLDIYLLHIGNHDTPDNPQARQDAAHVVANLQRQRVNSRLIASDYIEQNVDLVDILVPGYEDSDIALSYGAILRDCIRHQVVARYILESEHVKNFFDYIQSPNFDIASDAASTFKVEYGQEAVIQFVIEAIQAEAFNPKTLFLIGSYTIGKERLFLEVARVLRKKVYVTAAKLCPHGCVGPFFSRYRELLTRHKSTVADFLSRNSQWFFQEYNSRLLESPNYITRRHAVKLLGDMLLDRTNSSVMVRYVSSLDNMRILMNLLRDSNKTIQLNAFHVFKLFVANQNKPSEIVSILITNRSKFLRFFDDFKLGKDDEEFEADKAQVVLEIAMLEPRNDPCAALDKCDIPS